MPAGPIVFWPVDASTTGKRLAVSGLVPSGFVRWLGVIATAVLALACNQATSVERGEPTVTANTFKVDDLHITADDSGLIIQYRTSSSSTDCKAQAADAPKVWDLVVKPRLSDSHAERVILFPEDQSGTSVSFEFTKRASGQWSAAAPCSIAIPTGLAP
jgi:hypothetical protein